MELRKQPVTGMKDILPQEMAVRTYVLEQIRNTYAGFGFVEIETPAVESLQNLNSKQGGDNEKLIFQILKRGEKLQLEKAKGPADLVDSGLRYDLTVPLCRYYAQHAAELPSPFKALQIGSVWRADRPQRGRFRQFTQCDIDILGEASSLAEIDLILATATLLSKLSFRDFTIRINDRRILKAMADYSGFPEESWDDVFIIWDKMDKIGAEGVRQELCDAGYSTESAATCLALLEEKAEGPEAIRRMQQQLGEALDAAFADNLVQIMETVQAAGQEKFRIVFDPTLVRGMSYYTGPIFEIAMDAYGGSVGGGGRYDEMIGKFLGQPTPACGFSIGFERIIMLLLEQQFQVPDQTDKKVYLLDKKLSDTEQQKILRQAMQERAEGRIVDLEVMKKNKKFQKEQLTEQGYVTILEVFAEEREGQ